MNHLQLKKFKRRLFKLSIFSLIISMTLLYVVPKTTPVVRAMGEEDSLTKIYDSANKDIYEKAAEASNLLSPAVSITSTDGPITTSGAGLAQASPYPSTITVPSMTGTLATIEVTLNGITSGDLDELDFLLVAPTTVPGNSNGAINFLIASDLSPFANPNSVTNQTYTIRDGEPQFSFSVTPVTGTYGPTDFGRGSGATAQADPTDDPPGFSTFPAPAPQSPSPGYNSAGPNPFHGSAQTMNGVFGGINPTGNWTLYVFDDFNNGVVNHSIQSWTLTFTVNAVAAPTQTAISSNNNPSFTSGPGSAVALTANVTSSSTVNEGTVAFTDNGATISGCGAVAVSSGTAVCNTVFMNEGDRNVVASYGGTANFGASSDSLTQTVNNPTTVNGNEFCNTGNLIINDFNVNGGRATPYPSKVFVSGLTGVITDVNVQLKNVTHAGTNTGADHLDILLVGPNGAKFFLVGDAGGNPNDINNVTITFDDESATTLADETGGWGPPNSTVTSRPVNYGIGGEVFPAPAPAPPYLDPGATPGAGATLASAFDGSNPNGTWDLYVFDDLSSGVEGGNIANGWCANFTTAPVEPTTTTVSSNNNPSFTSAPGNAVTLTATVSSTSTVNEGTVDFTDGGSAISGCTGVAVSSGTATCMTTFSTEGEHPINAAYSGAITFGPSNGNLTQIANNHTTVVGQSYCNTGNLIINDANTNGGRATPYPSNIFISGLLGSFDGVTITLNNVTHNGTNTFADDLDLLLVGPAGQKFILVSDAGGNVTGPSNVTITFDDAAATMLADGSGGWGSGTVTSKPVNYGGVETFPAPAPGLPYADPGAGTGATLNGTFLGGGVNGTWSLYVLDDLGSGFEAGNFAGGWCVNPSMTPVSTTTSQVTSNNNPSQTTENVTFTAEVTAPTGTPTGTVEFFEDGNSLGTAMLMPGPAPFSGGRAVASPSAVAHAQLTHQFLFGGARNITAVYNGNLQPGGGGFAGSNSNANPLVQQVFGPTAAAVNISGRVVSGQTGRGIFKARVMLVDAFGQVRYATTNPFGYYRFTNVEAGETYTLNVGAKNYMFKPSTRILQVNEELTDINFISEN